MKHLGTAALLLLLASCDEEQARPPVTTSRSQSVVATGIKKEQPKAGAEIPAASAPKAAAMPTACVPSAKGQLPTDSFPGRAKSGHAFVGGELPRGKVTWINLWAAWCEPCKQEIPLLLRWQKEWKTRGLDVELVFVSLDDDERQLQRLLNTDFGVVVTYWLPEGEKRTHFLESLGVPPDPRLPEQVLTDDTGRLGCLIDGAVEARDEPFLFEKLSLL